MSTALIHHAYQPPAGFAAVQPAVHKASTVLFANVAALRARDWKHNVGYTYGLVGTPTFGVISAAEDGRILQLVVKYSF